MSAIKTARVKIKSFFSSKSGKASILGFLIAAVLFTIVLVLLPSDSEHEDRQACTKWEEKGYHAGEVLFVLEAQAAPDGKTWRWGQCAAKCGSESACQFWTLRLSELPRCTLKTNKGEFLASDEYVEGEKISECVEVVKQPMGLLARLGITAALVIPVAVLLAAIYIGYERGWYWRLWRKFFGGGRQWASVEDLHQGPRGTIRASIEMGNFGKLFGDDGKLVSKLVEEEIEEGEEQKKMQLQYEDLKKKARELEEHRRKMGEAVGEEPGEAQETDLQKKQREIEAEAEKIRLEMEMKPEQRWNVAGDTGDDAEAGEETMTSQTTRAKRAQRHGFASQDTEKAQAAAKARMTQKMEKKAGDSESAVDDEGKFTLKFKRVDGKEFGLKYGPGLIVTSIQADSVVADWNSSNPQKVVKEGDKVTSVNSVTASGEMLKLLRSKAEEELEIVFLRQPTA